MFLRTESDAELVARTRQGDLEAFNHLVARWEKRLYNYLLRLLGGRPGCRDDAMELAQEAFLKAYQRLGTLADAGKFAAWLYRIAHNLAYSHLRRPDPLEGSGEAVMEGWQDEWPGNWNDPARERGRYGAPSGCGREMEIAVARALERLPAEQREAIILKVYHGFRFEEIAEILSCPLSTVKTRVYAGFSQLRAALEPAPAPPRIARR